MDFEVIHIMTLRRGQLPHRVSHLVEMMKVAPRSLVLVVLEHVRREDR